MIHIIATAVKSGKGGISTALIGFCESDTLRDAGVNIIESHNENKPKLASFRTAAQRIRNDVKPGDVVWIHCARWVSMVRKYLLAYLAKRQGAKVFIQFHSTVTSNYTETVSGRLLLRRLYAIADGICVLSEWWRRLLVERLQFAPERIHIVPNPLDKSFERLALNESYQAPQAEEIKLLAMTRLVEGKNVGTVIEALAHLPAHHKLTVAGDGPLLKHLKKRTAELDLTDRVVFTGWVNYDQKIELLKQQNLFVLPSQFDAFGMGFLEAMSAGLPVVALRTGPTSDVVPHGRAGLLVDDCDPKGLAHAVTAALSEHKRFSLEARKYVATNYPADTILPELLRFFRRDFGRKPRFLGRLKQRLVEHGEPIQSLLAKNKVPLLYYNRIQNVGDALNPYLIEHLTQRKTYRVLRGAQPHILGIGSILHMSTPQSQVWGSGLLDTVRVPSRTQLEKMSFFAVRGKLTRDLLAKNGANVDTIALGDPAVLMNEVYTPRPATKRYRVGIVPHYADKGADIISKMANHDDVNVIDVQQAPEVFIDALAACDFILSSSLHGVILADTYATPNAWVQFSDYPGIGEFKFNDYFSTTHLASAPLKISTSEDLSQLIQAPEKVCCVRQFTADKKRLRASLPKL